MTHRSAPAVGAAIALAFLAGCIARPTFPLMTPIKTAQSFGYDDHRLDGGRYEVSYVTPPLQAMGYRFDLSPSEERTKELAFDLASLHAARLAEAAGYQGFDIVDRHSSVDDENLGPSWVGPGGPGWGGWGWGGGWGWRRWGGPDWYEPPEQRVQSEVTLTVVFGNAPKEGWLRAADVIQHVLQTYPGVESPGGGGLAAPAAPPPPVPAPRPTA
jgi:hypothetical protein